MGGGVAELEGARGGGGQGGGNGVIQRATRGEGTCAEGGSAQVTGSGSRRVVDGELSAVV